RFQRLNKRLIEEHIQPLSAARKRSRKGTCLDFNLRLATLSEKKHASSTSGNCWYLPERGGHSSSNRFDLHSNCSGKSPSNAQACTILPPFCWIQPSSIHCWTFLGRNPISSSNSI